MKIFCSGIGGIGLSAYAMHMKARGHTILGSDRALSPLTDSLEKEGVHVIDNQDGSALPDDVDLLVYSEAIPKTAPERVKAEKLGIRQISYFQGVGELAQGKIVICICGTHGKSSTTAMTARLLMEAGKNPSVVVGTKMFELEGKNYRIGDPDLWVVEACEYRRSFLYLHPTIILLTNVDGDHFDAFSSLEEYHHAFEEFLAKLPKDGTLITHLQDPSIKKLVSTIPQTILDSDTQPLIELETPGEHMRKNAQLVLSLGQTMGIPVEKASSILKGYRGSWRRMEERGVIGNDILVVDDYAHHPIEIKATLAAMKEKYSDRRLVVVFQPHTHDRTLSFWDDFTQAFQNADVLILTDIYDARPDIEKGLVDIPKFLDAIKQESKIETINGTSLFNTKTMFPSLLKQHDLLLIMGAGNIARLADDVMKGI
jgi:UDP-N-acetylmuramate--alanine ligase